MAVLDALKSAGEGIKGFGKELGGGLSNLAGNIPKAMLFIRDFTGDKMDEMDFSPKKASSNDISALRKLIKKRKQTASEKKSGQLIGAAVGTSAGSAQAADTEALKSALTGKGYLAFEVQYNPNKISMITTGGRIGEYKSMGDTGRRQYISVDNGTDTNFSVQLVFDQMNIQDAFITEGNPLTNPTVGNIVSTAQSIYTNATGEGYSVQAQTEGLISLLTFEQTRDIIFVWSEMFFHGILSDVTAHYTMFNKQGNPIRSVVDLTLKQSNTANEYTSDIAYWDEAFTAAFGAAGLNMTANKRSAFGSAVGNLTGLNL